MQKGTFRRASRRFAGSSASTSKTAGGSALGGFSKYFSGSSTSVNGGSAEAEGPLASLMGTVRSAGQNALSSVGLGSREDPEPELCGLTSFQRIIGFFVTFGLSAVCFMVAFFSLPILIISPSKFATTFSLGSLLAATSFALIRGPRSYFKDLISIPRLPWTAAYFGSLILTLYFSLFMRSYLFTILASVVQMVALVWFFGSYVPGGTCTYSEAPFLCIFYFTIR
ncbi:Got1/Sft2-like family-domain-containing protein [Chytridium lagenaria]|nr:Got1/Sft2-like family-domain-containing protein [Chytridium lagenaria]